MPTTHALVEKLETKVLITHLYLYAWEKLYIYKIVSLVLKS